ALAYVLILSRSGRSVRCGTGSNQMSPDDLGNGFDILALNSARCGDRRQDVAILVGDYRSPIEICSSPNDFSAAFAWNHHTVDATSSILRASGNAGRGQRVGHLLYELFFIQHVFRSFHAVLLDANPNTNPRIVRLLRRYRYFQVIGSSRTHV